LLRRKRQAESLSYFRQNTRQEEVLLFLFSPSLFQLCKVQTGRACVDEISRDRSKSLNKNDARQTRRAKSCSIALVVRIYTMIQHLRSLACHPGFFILLATLWGIQANSASAQNVIVTAISTDAGPAVTPATSPGPMSLDACIELGMAHQPSLDAARASLAAANSGKGGLDNFPLFARFLVRDLKIRKEQACEGITIAQAALTQAEWDTRYAITRNFFTVQYIRAQKQVVESVLRDLDDGYKKAKRLFESGDQEVKITKIDLDAIKIQTSVVRTKKSQVENGMLKALAALREAMGLGYDYPLEIAAVNLPAAVYGVKRIAEEYVDAKDDKGNVQKKTVKTEVIDYFAIYKPSKQDLIAAALSNRGELIQAIAASRVVGLEVDAQRLIFGPQGRTFATGSDIHVQPIPQGVMNGDYRPGAIGPEMPPSLAGPRRFRIARASDLFQRSTAVVDKATSLVSLDVEAQYLKWQEAVENIQSLSGIQDLARGLPERVQKLAPKDFTSAAVIQATTTAIYVQTQLNDEMHTHALALAGLERATAGGFRVYPAPAAAAK
jgi:outer membrane protein TolC